MQTQGLIFRLYRLRFAACVFFYVLTAHAAESYEPRQVAGWGISADLGERAGTPAQRAVFGIALRDQLEKLDILPVLARQRLRNVRVFVSSGTYRPYGVGFHPSEQWLRTHGYPLEFAGNIEICNWREFVTLVRTQPYILLHEMAHAYHHLRPELDAQILAAFERAKAAGLYQKVTRGHGQATQRAYALTNHREYFAELSEAYFGENDLFPYRRSELKVYDPVGFAMIEVTWKE